MNRLLALCLTSLILFSCQQEKSEEATRPAVASSDFFDLDQIQASGEIIILTLYGPQNYMEERGQQMGLQFQIAQAYAKHIGVKVRVEIANDEQNMLEQLRQGEADLIAYPFPLTDSLKNDIIWCGDSLETRKASWVVRANSPLLAESLKEWFYGHSLEVHAIYCERERRLSSQKYRARVTRKSPMKNAARGIISDYDNLFRLNCKGLGWDWKLLAAMSYQESAFDPDAVSWAGACGLMQLMPSTAQRVGVSQDRLFTPADNVRGGTKYLRILNSQFSEIKNPTERINFILAAYNCGTLHVKDAQALAQKYNKNPHVWKGNVEETILLLQDSKYYRDNVVKNGYCRGSETYHYVRSIQERYRYYRSKIR